MWIMQTFSEWLRIEHPSRFRHITLSWIESLRVRRSHSSLSRLTLRKFWTLEEVEKILDFPTENTLRFKRDKAALAFLYLSGMRGAAFVTMPLRSVDLSGNKVYQLPEWGVKTKNSKAAVTFLFPIPRLLQAVKEWDDYVRSVAVSDRVAWYTKISPDGFKLVTDDMVTDRPPSGRRSAMYEGLRELCAMVGIEWKSPHKVRHGHGVYGVKHAKTMAEYKAHSQNMMHDTLETTDRTYAGLVNDEVGDIIKSFKPD